MSGSSVAAVEALTVCQRVRVLGKPGSFEKVSEALGDLAKPDGFVALERDRRVRLDLKSKNHD